MVINTTTSTTTTTTTTIVIIIIIIVIIVVVVTQLSKKTTRTTAPSCIMQVIHANFLLKKKKKESTQKTKGNIYALLIAFVSSCQLSNSYCQEPRLWHGSRFKKRVCSQSGLYGTWTFYHYNTAQWSAYLPLTSFSLILHPASIYQWFSTIH